MSNPLPSKAAMVWAAHPASALVQRLVEGEWAVLDELLGERSLVGPETLFSYGPASFVLQGVCKITHPSSRQQGLELFAKHCPAGHPVWKKHRTAMLNSDANGVRWFVAHGALDDCPEPSWICVLPNTADSHAGVEVWEALAQHNPAYKSPRLLQQMLFQSATWARPCFLAAALKACQSDTELAVKAPLWAPQLAERLASVWEKSMMIGERVRDCLGVLEHAGLPWDQQITAQGKEVPFEQLFPSDKWLHETPAGPGRLGAQWLPLWRAHWKEQRLKALCDRPCQRPRTRL